MTGKLILFTDNPDSVVTLMHDSGITYTSQAVNGVVTFDPIDLPDGNGATLRVDGVNYRGVLWMSTKNPANGSASFAVDTFPFKRKVVPKSHTPLPPFDISDSFGEVHTSLPAEQIIPTQPDIMFWRGDIAGVMLPERPPEVQGDNTNFDGKMVMSFLLHLYPREWQDKILTAHAERGYTHFHLSKASSIDLFRYVQSWGFFTSYWATARGDTNWGDLLLSLIDNNLLEKTIIVVGGELNSFMSPDDLLVAINQINKICRPAKVALHFTSNIPSWQVNGTSSYEWWDSLAGKVDFLLWQGNQDNSAGEMGGHLWDARLRVRNNARVVAFELIATNQLYNRPLHDGRKPTEEMGCLRGWEMLCSTRTSGSNIRAVSGFGNGSRYPNGNPI